MPDAADALSALGGAPQQLQGLMGTAMGGPDLGAQQAALGRLTGLEDQRAKALAPDYEKVAKATDEAQSGIEKAAQGIEPIGSRVKPWTQPPPQEDPLKNFGSLGAIFATLASAFTHQPMVNAMNAQASALNAIKQNDLDGYNQSFKAWQSNTQLALDRHAAQMQDFDAAMKVFKSKPEAANAALKAHAAKYDDQIVAVLTETGQLDKLAQLQESRANAARSMLSLYPDIVDKGTRAALVLESQKVANMPPGPEKTAAMDAYRQKVSAYGEARAAGTTRTATPQGVALQAFLDEHKGDNDGKGASADDIAAFNQKNRAAPRSAPAMAMQKFMEENKDATADDITNFGAQYKARGAAVQAFATGKQGDIVRSFNVATQHLDTLQDLGKALENHDVQTFNKLGNALARETGQVAPTNFDTAKTLVANEITKAIIGMGGTGEDRAKAQSAFNEAQSPQQLKQAIDTIKTLVHGQLVGLEKQFVDTGVGSEADFRKRLSGTAAKELSAGGALPSDLPSPAGLRDGVRARDTSGQVVAVIKDGQWVAP